MTNSNPVGNPRMSKPILLPADGKRPKRAARNAEYRNFEDLTRTLAQVPKSELDDKRKA